MPDDQTATVWAATHVPAGAPLPDVGEGGYSVAWVDGPEGRVQALVAGEHPAVGATGRLTEREWDGVRLPVFEAVTT